ncbi:CRISPR-associated protein Cmr3 [Bacteroidia bacterium]|nr:CRISPR-associated protein Cmr3 [Bacteroidia bacterium]
MKYLITLTPTGKFYFGGDNTFEVAGNDLYSKDTFGSYIVASNCFPQQTSLLGMLRFLLLSNSDAFDKNLQEITKSNKDKAKELIGQKSFHIGESNNFGKIESIGTCFIRRGHENFFPAPKDFQLRVNFSQITDGKFNGAGRKIPTICYWDKKENKIEDYMAKFHSENLFVSENHTIKFDGIFIEDRRIGIDRDVKTGIVEDGALYKQISYRLRNGYCFAFTAEIADNYKFEQHNDSTVQIGGDNSNFLLNIEKIETGVDVKYKKKYEKLNDNLSDFHKVTLTANTFLAKDEIDFDFAIAEILPFKFLQTSVNTTNYYITSKEVTKSDKFELFANGSVFYFQSAEKMQKFKNSINKYEADFQKIGYNLFINN